MALVDIVAPPGLRFNQRNVVLGDYLAKVLAVVNYPPRVQEAWLARLANMPGVVVSVSISPGDPFDMLRALNSSIQEFSSRIAAGGQALSVSRWEQSMNDAKELLKKIDQEAQKVYNTTVTILITAQTEDELNKKSRQVEAMCAAQGMRARTIVFRQEEGLKTVGPFGLIEKNIAEMAGKDIPSETIAASYPFVSSGLNHGRGIVLGRDADEGLILIDRWKRPQGTDITNPNMNILGTSGGGKSFAAKMILLREYALGARVLILDPEREYKKMCRELDGSWINAAGGAGKINPLEIRPVPDVADDDEEQAEEESIRGPLSAHLQRVKTLFQLYLPGLSDIERAILDDCILAAYNEYGITWQTEPATVHRFPILADVYKHLQEKGQERLCVLFKSAVEGADAALWNGQTTIPAVGDFTVLDIRDLTDASDNVRRAQYFNILSYAWDLVREGRAEGKRTVLVVDEAWLLADPQTPQAIGFLRDLSKRIRKYNGSLTIITQNIIDFLAPEIARLGQPVITNASMKLLMRQESRDLEALTELMKLSETEVDLLAGAKIGHGLLLAGNNRVYARIEASAHELEAIG